jgi:hypothetical protein
MTPQPVRPTHPRAQQATSAAPRSRIIQVKKVAPPVMREAVSSEEEESEVDEEEKEQVEEAQDEEEEQDEADDEERKFNDDTEMASCDEKRSEVEKAEAEPMVRPAIPSARSQSILIPWILEHTGSAPEDSLLNPAPRSVFVPLLASSVH